MKYVSTGRIITLIIACLILSLSFAFGKNNFFLVLNTDLGRPADYFFEFFTYTGDGMMWIPALFITLFILKKRNTWLLLVSAFIISTVLTQVCKYFIVPDEPRPVKAIADISLIHIVPGVEMHTVSSFPSGHTATAFTFYLLFCFLINRRWWLITGLIYALLVGYSRIYLAEHFPSDVAAGMIVGAISASISFLLNRWWLKKKNTPVTSVN